MLVAGLIVAEAVLGPGGPGPGVVKDQPKAQVARPMRIIPLERPRDEEQPGQLTAGAAASATQPTPINSAPPSRETAPTPTFTVLTGLPTPQEAARATRLAQEKIAAEKAKRRLARERARARALAAAAARSPDQQYFGLQTPDYAYAPRRTYGPFGHSQNGWGNNGWNWGGGWKGQNGKW